MNELQIFKNPEFGEIRTLVIENEPWIVGKDVAVSLRYSNTKDALASHVDDEDKKLFKGRKMRPLIFQTGELPSSTRAACILLPCQASSPARRSSNAVLHGM